MNDTSYAGDVTPDQAWRALESEADAVLVDVRTESEWHYVGLPDLSELGKEPLLISWQFFPAMDPNPEFASALEAACPDRNARLLFLCRGAIRSKEAAIAMTARGFTRCYNVSGGFEGPVDEERRRGRVSGWKAAGLRWAQT
ncbi:MAG: rhodanese-like domain-containing protein [Rhodospirillales bacterium]|jgi:rhodanese-related sulfurtransferase|nr:rhodanese-like domain-containing protein [Rhodospirillales bacterium]